MYVQFLDENKTRCNIEDCTYVEFPSIIQLTGNNIPEISDIGFEVYSDDDTLLYPFENFHIVYDKGTNYIQYTNDISVYNDFLIFDESNLVKYILITTDYTVENGYLYQSGRGKKYKHFDIPLFDNNGYSLYKITDNMLIETTTEERQIFAEKLAIEALESAKKRKIMEIDNICSSQITTGVCIDNQNYSYTIEDQSNLLTALQIAVATNMSVPYHSNGTSCRLFTKDEIINMYVAQSANLTHHLTYSNQLKLYVQNELFTIDEVDSVTYGQDLTGEYLQIYNIIITQATANATKYIENLQS